MLPVPSAPSALLPMLSSSSLPQRSTLQSNDTDPELSKSSSRTAILRLGRPQTQVTCVECHRGKTKVNQAISGKHISVFALTAEQCDGHRPSCARCATYEYDVEPDTSHLISIRQMTERADWDCGNERMVRKGRRVDDQQLAGSSDK
jgi:hypothetical protein